eukprot:2448641-Pyramimonas_sp.AAC.1
MGGYGGAHVQGLLVAEALQLLQVRVLQPQFDGQPRADVLAAREQRQHRDALQHRALARRLLAHDYDAREGEVHLFKQLWSQHVGHPVHRADELPGIAVDQLS